jgi:ketosteroid isomerase-like protein
LKKLAILGLVACAIALFVLAQQSNAKESDEAEIRAMEAAMMKGFAARDLDTALAVYVQDDTCLSSTRLRLGNTSVSRHGAQTTKTSSRCSRDHSRRKCPTLVSLQNGKLGFGHNIQRFAGTGKDGKPLDLIFRVSDGYKKINGKWMIVEEHLSFPLDVATGKGDMSSKP